ncbi:MAG: N-acyl homoserine lactone hydrolase [Patiriisocius sp.]|jgi:N-acyl homoserine lactone hydrolase
MEKFVILFILSLATAACTPTTIETMPASLGMPATMSDLLDSLEKPGVIEFNKHVAGDWAIELSGLLNLEHPKAIAAGLSDRVEPIQLFTYSLKHPTKGTYLVDSGLSEEFRDIPNNQQLSFIIKKAMNIDLMKVHLTTAELFNQLGGIDGVFLTHIHMDHIMGLTDLGSEVDVYIGPGDTTVSNISNAATQGTTDRLLAHVTVLQEWQFEEDGIVDIFGDGSVWAIHSPGHTPGATAYLANTLTGPQLMLGDATHTAWGWQHGVEAGTFSEDIPQSAMSLARLKKLAEDSQRITAHPGHQSLTE